MKPSHLILSLLACVSLSANADMLESIGKEARDPLYAAMTLHAVASYAARARRLGVITMERHNGAIDIRKMPEDSEIEYLGIDAVSDIIKPY